MNINLCTIMYIEKLTTMVVCYTDLTELHFSHTIYNVCKPHPHNLQARRKHLHIVQLFCGATAC